MPDQGDDNLSGAPEHKTNTFVVGIGASAGGIGALREFFNRVGKDSGMAYVVILHLSPQHESSLPELLQSRTTLPVTQVTEPVKVQPNHVYVIPPLKYLIMSDGMIRLTEPERTHGHPTSIDLFFRTLADAYGKDCVAILLSGVGADGTIGLGRIKEQGGFAIAQDPSEAEYDNMPRSAIDAGLVDLIMPVAEMPAKLVALREAARRLQISGEREEELPRDFDEAALRNITTLLRLRTGNDFSQYRRPTLLRRIARRMQVRELHDLNSYLTFLRDHQEEVSALLRDLLITVTNFFRDSEAFARLQKEVVPQMFAGKTGEDQVRVWSAGCATGEEAYSLAILMAEHAATLPEPPKVQIFATDIDERAISQGREGRYPDTISVDINADRLRHFFTKEADYYRIRKQIREMVLFAPHNLLRDPPFSRLDLISCRNLLIYLNREMQERVLEILHFAIRPDGFLFLGSSETAENVPALFLPIDKKSRIYRRRELVGVMQPTPTFLGGRVEIRPPAIEGSRHDRPTAGELHHEAVELLAPPSVLVNEEFEVLHSSAQAGRYLHIAGGEPTRNLLKLVDPALQLDLRSLLFEARARGDAHAAVIRKVRIKQNGETHWMNLSVRQITAVPRSAQGFFLITFDETTEPAQPEIPATDDEAAKIALVRELEQQLQQVKDQLRITIEQHETSTEELRASNEELQAINEELRSATEELETSKEELQSVNEELSTVNQEYKEKIEEVGRSNSDLQNLMASIDIATIFLDRSFQIKRYTPRAQALFNITVKDIGRPLEHFTNKLDYRTLHEDAEHVLNRLETIEHEVRGVDDRLYLARLTPYRTAEDKIDGVVLTFVDITNRKQFEERLLRQTIELREQAELLNLSTVLVLGDGDRIIMWNSGCERLYGYSSSEAVGKVAHELLHTEFSTPLPEIHKQLQQTGRWQGDLVHTTRAGEKLIVASHWIRHQREHDRPAVILQTNNDITARRKAEDALVEADRNKDRFLLALGHELRNPLGAMLSSLTLLRRPEVTPQASARARDIIERQLNNLVRLVDDLLDVERLTRARITLKKEPVEISAVINAALESTKPVIDGQGHKLEVTMPKERIVVDGDLARLCQVVGNLLHNACKYSPPKSRIGLKVERAGSEVVIRVQDSGIGVAAEMMPKLFEMFAQAPPSAGAQLQGFGVGLALARQLVELHGGAVTAHSDGLGKGSEFVVRLPIAGQAAARKAPAAPIDPAKLPKRRVLIVEDNADSGDAMAALLRNDGHEVRVVTDGAGALAIAAQFKPEAAIVDIGLPGLDGYEVATRIRQLLPKIVLVALSGWPANQTDHRTQEAGFKHYFVKPLEHEQLNRILAEI